MKMVNKYFQNYKERLQKEAREWYQNLSEEEKIKRDKRLEKDIKLLLNRKKKKGFTAIGNINRSFLII